MATEHVPPASSTSAGTADGRLDGTSVVVVGGGIGGLSTACYLAAEDADVTVVEKNEQLGGRASRLSVDGFRFDMGPSWYLMPDAFERFFAHFGRSPSDYYELTHLEPHYRVFWKDGDRVDAVGDVETMKGVFESYEAGAGEALERYLDQAERNYRVGTEQFVYTDRGRFRDFLDLDVLRSARGLTLLGSMEKHVAKYFDHPKLRQLVQYSLVFLGGSPANTPALYSLMSHVDFGLGVHYPDGGLGAVVDAVVDLGTELGVTYETGRAVTGIRAVEPGGEPDAVGAEALAADGAGGSTTGGDGTAGQLRVDTDAGPLFADVVVSDADYAHTERELLDADDRQYDDDYWDGRTYAPSAFLLYLGVEGDVEPLAHHTLVLPEDWGPHFERIFDEPAWPDDPAYYLCVPSRTDDTVAPEGHSNLFALVPIAPGLEDDEETRQTFRDRLLEDVAANTGVDIRDRIVVEEHFTVSDFASRYNSTQGTALGLAHTLGQTGPLRPSHRSDALAGLYYTGAFTTPGIGVPMCLVSGEHAAEAVVEDRGRS